MQNLYRKTTNSSPNYTKGEKLWDSFIYITTQTFRLWIA